MLPVAFKRGFHPTQRTQRTQRKGRNERNKRCWGYAAGHKSAQITID